jgi:hypothetical protein
MRDNKWLADLLDSLHTTYFPEIVVENTILVRFGRASRTRFGSIIAKPTHGYRLPTSRLIRSLKMKLYLNM